MNKLNNFWYRFWHDNHQRIVVWQTPNKFLIIWLIATILNKLILSESVSNFMVIVATSSIMVWCFLEIRWGVNYFRRLLGLMVLIFVLRGILI